MGNDHIPVWSYEDEYRELRPEILNACDRVFSSGRLVLGEEGKRFEQSMAASLGVAGGVGVNNGTDAIFIALRALGIGEGDEVITVPNTAVPTVSAIVTIGARPVFVDVNEDLLLDVGKLERAITAKTKAIIPVHLYGQCVDMDKLMDIATGAGIKVVEDVAQAQGALYKGRPAGSIGHASTFSFYPTKILGAYGDAGMVLSRDEKVLSLARSLRFYGMESAYYSERSGFNSRMDEVQAAILSLKLPHVPRWIDRRRDIARRYAQALAATTLECPKECAYGTHVYHLYVARHAHRDKMVESLAARGVGCSVNYRWPIHLMRGFAHLGYREGDFPMAEKGASRVFSLPLFPQLSDAQVDAVIGAVRDADEMLAT